MDEENKKTDQTAEDIKGTEVLPELDVPEPEQEKQASEEPEENTLEDTDKNVSKDETKSSRLSRLKSWYFKNPKHSIGLSLLALLVLVFAIPFSRYQVVGLVIKKDYNVVINDATSNTPVSGATVSYGSVNAQTDGNGKARLHLSVGPKKLSIAKKYYQDTTVKVTVPILGQKTTPIILFTATGRQVKVNVTNLINKQKLAGVNIKVADIDAKTDKDGSAVIVLPVGNTSQAAVISADGYNDASVTITVSDSKIAENNYNLTPVGKIYFLSKLSGKIDVVKTNLDGTQRETAFGGTGREDDQNTVLLASRDWKYLALLSRRDSDFAKLYIMQTSDDSVTAIDEGNADFSLIGWSDNDFVYQVNRIGYQLWQPKAHAIKSYNVLSNKTVILDETDAQGTSDYDYNYEIFTGINIVGQKVVYSKSWYETYYSSASLTDNQMGIYGIAASGGGGRSTYKTFSYSQNESTYLQSYLAKPDQVDYQVVEKGAEPKYFVYSSGQVTEKVSIKDEFDQYLNGAGYFTYLISPSSELTYWSESRDGKNSLFVGNALAENAKTIATLSDLQTYGWFGDDYLLASKKGSELYILSVGGIKKDVDAIKITDYHKPVVNYYGYGGGYGGI